MRVLLIEDDSATAQSIELMLQSEGFNVYTTDLGEEGVDLGPGAGRGTGPVGRGHDLADVVHVEGVEAGQLGPVGAGLVVEGPEDGQRLGLLRAVDRLPVVRRGAVLLVAAKAYFPDPRLPWLAQAQT